MQFYQKNKKKEIKYSRKYKTYKKLEKKVDFFNIRVYDCIQQRRKEEYFIQIL